MVNRIKRIIEEKGFHAGSFADKIMVSRGTISHIMNGRNDPSKDTIDKILKSFPDISSSWLLSGEGPMYIRERVFIQPIQSDLFDEKQTVELPKPSQRQEYSLKNEVKMPENKANSPIIQDITPPSISNKKIDKIMIFFSDKTFMTFLPED